MKATNLKKGKWKIKAKKKNKRGGGWHKTKKKKARYVGEQTKRTVEREVHGRCKKKERTRGSTNSGKKKKITVMKEKKRATEAQTAEEERPFRCSH